MAGVRAARSPGGRGVGAGLPSAQRHRGRSGSGGGRRGSGPRSGTKARRAAAASQLASVRAVPPLQPAGTPEGGIAGAVPDDADGHHRALGEKGG